MWKVWWAALVVFFFFFLDFFSRLLTVWFVWYDISLSACRYLINLLSGLHIAWPFHPSFRVLLSRFTICAWVVLIKNHKPAPVSVPFTSVFSQSAFLNYQKRMSGDGNGSNYSITHTHTHAHARVHAPPASERPPTSSSPSVLNHHTLKPRKNCFHSDSDRDEGVGGRGGVLL